MAPLRRSRNSHSLCAGLPTPHTRTRRPADPRKSNRLHAQNRDRRPRPWPRIVVESRGGPCYLAPTRHRDRSLTSRKPSAQVPCPSSQHLCRERALSRSVTVGHPTPGTPRRAFPTDRNRLLNPQTHAPRHNSPEFSPLRPAPRPGKCRPDRQARRTKLWTSVLKNWDPRTAHQIEPTDRQRLSARGAQTTAHKTRRGNRPLCCARGSQPRTCSRPKVSRARGTVRRPATANDSGS